MQWYYANQGKQAGPVDDAGLEALIRQGTVQPHTLVWREGMGQWQQLSVARPASSPAAASSPMAPAPAPTPAPTPAPAPAPQAAMPQSPAAPRPVSPAPTPAPQAYTPQAPSSPMQPQQPYSQPQFGQGPQQGFGQPQPPQGGMPQYGQQPSAPSAFGQQQPGQGYGQPQPPQPAAPRPQSNFEQMGFGQPKQPGASDFGAMASGIGGAVAGGVAGAVAGMGGPSQTITCVNCGQLFPSSAAVMIGSSWVCGNCKPVYMQRMREGGASAGSVGGMKLAGFGVRLGAYLIDSVITTIVAMIVMIPIGMISGVASVSSSGEVNPAAFGIIGIGYLVLFAAILGYHGYFLSTKGATPGKQVLGLKVIRTNGAPLSMGRAIGRFLSYMISSMPLYLGFLMIAFDKEKRGLHDMICDTRVVSTR